MSVMEINDDNFLSIINTKGKVLVDCYANWCGPCKMLAPIIEEISCEYSDVKFYKLDVDSSSLVTSKYNIMSIPTLLFFKDGNLESTSVGFKSKEEVLDIIK